MQRHLAQSLLSYIETDYRGKRKKSFVAIETQSVDAPQMLCFSASWCGHCRRLDPEWKKAAGQRSPANWHVIDCSNAAKLNELPVRYRERVNGYPTILTLRKNRLDGYSGGRFMDELISHYDSLEQ